VFDQDSEPADDQLLVTAEEAARRLGLGRTTVYDLLARGMLPSVTIGRCRRVPVSSLRSFIDRLLGERSLNEHSRAIEQGLTDTALTYDQAASCQGCGVQRHREPEVTTGPRALSVFISQSTSSIGR
jgi:excisionase family DNA binding protein